MKDITFVEVYTKQNCGRCKVLKDWLHTHQIEFQEHFLEDPVLLQKLLKDPVFSQQICHQNLEEVYPPILYVPDQNLYLAKQIFGIDGLRSQFLEQTLTSSFSTSVFSSIMPSNPSEQFVSKPSYHSNDPSFEDQFSLMVPSPPLQFCRNELVERLLHKYILAIGISRTGGDLLYFIQVDKSLNLELTAQFISALSMLGEENLGKIDRVLVKGLQIELSIVTRHELVFFVMFRAHMVQDHLDEESEKCLERFYQKYKDVLGQKKNNRAVYKNFDKEMCLSIQNYLVRLGILECVDCNLEIPILREVK